MQAGSPSEIAVNNGSSPGQLTVLVPRSVSLPLSTMGNAPSKHSQSPRDRSPAPSVASTLKRAFARRKKPDDSRSLADSFAFAQSPRVELSHSSASSPPVPPKGPKFSQLASHVFSPSKKAPPSRLHHPSPIAPANSQSVHPPPPPPPKSASDPQSVAHTTLTRSHAPVTPVATLAPSLPAAMSQNRSSIIPMSPGIESAVSYMAISDQLQQLAVLPLPSLPSSSTPSGLPAGPTQPVPSSAAAVASISDGQPTPEIQGTSSPQEAELEEVRRVERPRARSESEGVLVERDYADKRKSDSTISHCTIRPGAGGLRSSRPVSMAESFQSSYTIVPGNGNTSGIVVVNKRLSAVDVDLDMLEEDDDSFKSLDDADANTADKRASVLTARGGDEKTSALRQQKRRSMSLNVGVGASGSSPVTQVYHPPPSASATELKHPSYSISEGFYSQHPTISSSMATSQSNPPPSWAGRLPPNRNQKLPAIPPHANPNVNTTFTYPTRRPLPDHPAPPPSFRQTAVSLTSSLAPAAGLARKAVEKVKGAWGHMGTAGGHHHHHHPHHHQHDGSTSGSISSTSTSSASGYSSSVSVSSTSASSYPNANEWGVMGLVRTPSNQSSATHATHSSSVHMHAVNIKEIKERSERERLQQQQPGSAKKDKGGRRRRTPGQSGGGSSSVGSMSASGYDSDGFMMPSGPILGVMLRGPARGRNGGVVFGRDLAKAVRDTAVWVGKEGGAGAVGEGDGKEMMGRPELKVYEQRMLPAIVVRCAQHLLIWGVQEEGLFRWVLFFFLLVFLYKGPLYAVHKGNFFLFFISALSFLSPCACGV
ncbi:hypothetical protein P691DRAFT_211736 [Macrolepiota fuliginosa MF-IS2]|uniref:Uncharacterized protein n=1 Tax=Macrolepiota fuliginosa MF-IS2 TaxID=1400762 RepID=A0A9P5X8C1_9AGAR|nr:hypothetical protein P691DRAFT_211736 [Macrolepiota fuliginosa MF-IS2]